jgi:hypothetical protein
LFPFHPDRSRVHRLGQHVLRQTGFSNLANLFL